MSQYTEGQIVKCISSDFAMISTTEDDKSKVGKPEDKHPTEGNYYQIGEVLGDYFSFSHFNDETMRWWHHSRFRLATLIELEAFGLTNIANAKDGEILKPIFP